MGATDTEPGDNMSEDQCRFLMLRQLPARLTAQEVTWLLGCQLHDVPALLAAKLLKPLGQPAPNGIKFFATREVLARARDEQWLHRVTATITRYWQGQNQRKRLAQQREPDRLAA